MKKTPALFYDRMGQKIDCEYNPSSNSIEVGQFRRYYDGINVGSEISKDGEFKRVGLILRNNLGNGLVMIAPLTTKNHAWMEKYYIPIMEGQKYGLKQANIILNQIKCIDTRRFVAKVSDSKISGGFINKVLFTYIDLVLGFKKRPDTNQGRRRY